MNPRGRAGVTLIEMMIAVVIAGVLLALGFNGIGTWSSDQRAKGAARDVADAFALGRAEAMRTSRNHLVVFDALGAPSPVVVVDDGPPATANCQIDAGEIRHSVPAEMGISWGTTPGLAGATQHPDDLGGSGQHATGSTFTDANSPTGDASWVLFQPDGLPRTFTPSGGNCTPIGLAGQGGGGIYLSNGRRDYAILLSHLGTARVHVWDPAGAWRL